MPNENNRLLLVGWEGNVIAQHGLREGKRPLIETEKPIQKLHNCPINTIRVIDGQAYIAAAWRTVFKREGIDQWTCLLGNNPEEVKELQSRDEDVGFEDIGGFSKDEIYACGENGDLWHFNGTKWRPLSTPTNKDMVSMCCAPNGKVYIGCEDGTLIEGRGDSWKVLKHKASDDLSGMIWYKDKLYIGSEMYGLSVYNPTKNSTSNVLPTFAATVGKEEGISDDSTEALQASGMSEEDAELFKLISSVKMSGDIRAPSGLHSLATDGEILLIAGRDNVVAFNGEEWKMLFSSSPSKEGGELW